MPKKEDIQHSFLIVSASKQFNAVVSRSLNEYLMVEYRKSAAIARRCVLERYYDIIVINSPLPDEFGEQLALDMVQQCHASILLVVPSDNYESVLESVTDQGILVVSKPLPRGILDKAIRFLAAVQVRMKYLDKQIQISHEKMEEIRLIDRAKFLLIEKRHMTENEAHRYIGKEAMDHGFSRKRISEMIIDDLD